MGGGREGESERSPSELVSLSETPEPLGTQREHKLGRATHPALPGGTPLPPSLSPLTNGVARGSHSGPRPIRCWVKRLLNFGPDDPAIASQQRHTSHAPSCLPNFSPGQPSFPQPISDFLLQLFLHPCLHWLLQATSFPSCLLCRPCLV